MLMIFSVLAGDGNEQESSVAGDTARTFNGIKPTAATKQYSNAATICGDVHITRICEPRVLENQVGFQPDFGLLSDDKALRYTSKAATLLGLCFLDL